MALLPPFGARSATENLLPLLDDLLTKQGFKIKDCQGVAVVQGPGSFTALRLGVISANLIADFCQCPSVGLAATEFTADQKMVDLIKHKISLADKQARVLPDYQKEPNITKPKP